MHDNQHPYGSHVNQSVTRATRQLPLLLLCFGLLACVQVPGRNGAKSAVGESDGDTEGAIWALEEDDAAMPMAGAGGAEPCSAMAVPVPDGPASPAEPSVDSAANASATPGMSPAAAPAPAADAPASAEPMSTPADAPAAMPVAPAGEATGESTPPEPGDTDVANTTPSTEPPVEAEPQVPAPAQGDLVITEVMPNPAALTDSEGEWLELYNASGHALDLATCHLGDDDAAGVALGQLVLAAEEIAVVARSEAPGFRPDLVASFSLRNSADVLVVRCGEVVVDRVSYGDEGGPAPVAGVSLSLAPEAWDAISNDAAGAWCRAQGEGASGDVGTPGAANGACGS